LGERKVSTQLIIQNGDDFISKNISIKQLDSLSASINLTFTEKFQAQNLETINSGKNSVLH
jgi:hypothetical protein